MRSAILGVMLVVVGWAQTSNTTVYQMVFTGASLTTGSTSNQVRPAGQTNHTFQVSLASTTGNTCRAVDASNSRAAFEYSFDGSSWYSVAQWAWPVSVAVTPFVNTGYEKRQFTGTYPYLRVTVYATTLAAQTNCKTTAYYSGSFSSASDITANYNVLQTCTTDGTNNCTITFPVSGLRLYVDSVIISNPNGAAATVALACGASTTLLPTTYADTKTTIQLGDGAGGLGVCTSAGFLTVTGSASGLIISVMGRWI